MEADDAIATLPDELVLHVAEFIKQRARDVCAWASTCRRLRAILADESLWRTMCAEADPHLAECDPYCWGRNWRWLYAAHACPLPRRHVKDEGAPTEATAGRRAICVRPAPSRARAANLIESDAAYVGEVDAAGDPHGYGLLYFKGIFKPHHIRVSRAQGDEEEEAARVSPPDRTIDVDVATRAVPGGRAHGTAFLFPADDGEACAREEHSAEAALPFDPPRSHALSTGDRIEGLWRHGCIRRGTVRAFDRDGGLYYEGEVDEGLYEGWGRSVDLDGMTYEGEWRAGRRDGHAVVRTCDRVSYAGQWATFGRYASAPHGLGILCDPHGFALEGGWHGGQRHGEVALFYGPVVYMRVYVPEPGRVVVRVVNDDLKPVIAALAATGAPDPRDGLNAPLNEQVTLVPDDGRTWEDAMADGAALATFSIPVSPRVVHFFVRVAQAYIAAVAAKRQ
jgi:hypothetical protein